ncbi:hypothetical protein APLC1_0107 [Limnospira platensis C1]|nr:hypothetical protein APLC1_0107 [Arthrospira platensis C1]
MSMSSGKFGMVWGLTVYSLLSCESFGVLYVIVLRCQANLGLNSGSKIPTRQSDLKSYVSTAIIIIESSGSSDRY